VAIAVALSGLTLWLAARSARIDQLKWAFAGANYWWLVPYPLLGILLNMIRGEIWRRFLDKRVSSPQAFWAYTVGFLVNNVLPFRLGEAARVVVLARRSALPIVEVAAAAGLERLLDLVCLALLVALVSPAVGGNAAGVLFSALVAGAVAAGAVAVIIVLTRFRDRPPTVVARVIGRLPAQAARAATERWTGLVRATTILLRPSVGVPTVLGALAVWVLTVILQWLVLRAFQPAAELTDAGFMVGAVSLAIALPGAPSFIGLYHWAGQQSLTLAFPARYDASTALAAATVAHASSFVISTALGIVGLWYFGMAPASVRRALATMKEGEPVPLGEALPLEEALQLEGQSVATLTN
jgi:hypothetical protein